MHKITSVEAQRVIAIMEDAQDKLECLTYVPCTAKPELLDALVEAGENPIRNCLQMLWHMEHVAIKSGAMTLDTRAGVKRGTHPIDDAVKRDSESFVPKLPYIGVDKAGKRANVVGGVSKDTIGRGDHGAGTTPGGGDLSKEDCLEQVYQVTREWCRLLRRHPHAMEILITYAREYPRLESGIVYNRLMNDLTGIIYRRLSTSVEEEVMNRNLLNDLSEREKLAEEERFTLQQTLDATRADKDRELGALAVLIRKRRDNLQEVNHANAVEMESIRSKTAEAIAKAKEDHEKKGKALTEHIERLLREMAETAERYQQEEVASRKKKTKMEVELAATVEKYDRDMAIKTAQIDDLKAKMAEECQELAVLQFHFNRIDTSDRYKQEEEKILAEVEMKVARAMAVVDGAATKLQSLFRGNRDRVEFQKAKKKKKKKKKGKKKGKGGKKGKKR